MRASGAMRDSTWMLHSSKAAHCTRMSTSSATRETLASSAITSAMAP